MASKYDYFSMPSYMPDTTLYSQGSPLVPSVDPTATSAYVNPKAALDGTNAFGANSQPNGGFDLASIGGMNVLSNGPSGGEGGGGGLMNWLFGNGTKDSPGNIGSMAGLAQGLFSGWLGMQQYGLAKDKLAESKKQFDMNYAANRQMTNSQLEDRQRARVAANPGAYQSVGDYMNTYGIK